MIEYNKQKCITPILIILMLLLSYGSAINNAHAFTEETIQPNESPDATSTTIVTYAPTAQFTIGAPGCPYPNSATTCNAPGSAQIVSNALYAAFRSALVASAEAVEGFGHALLSTAAVAWLVKLELIEKELSKHWLSLWRNTIMPALKKMTRQMNVRMADSARRTQSFMDANGLNDLIREKQLYSVQLDREHRTSESGAIASTLFGGISRANMFSRAIRRAQDKQNIKIGTNAEGNTGATTARLFETNRSNEYKEIFCDPDDLGGRNVCDSTDEKYYNADTQPTKFIYNMLTIPINPNADTEGNMAKTLNHINLNLFNSPAMDPITKNALTKQDGQSKFLKRRSYIARHSATRSVQNLITGWRMPGSKAAEWSGKLRTSAHTPTQEISTNPSYREIMHALIIDRFNSGKYAQNLISDVNNIEMEKLILEALYLIQLRDYYELLERTALVLSMQLILTIEDADVSSATESSSIK